MSRACSAIDAPSDIITGASRDWRQYKTNRTATASTVTATRRAAWPRPVTAPDVREGACVAITAQASCCRLSAAAAAGPRCRAGRRPRGRSGRAASRSRPGSAPASRTRWASAATCSRRAGEREPVEHRVRDQRAGLPVAARRDQIAEWPDEGNGQLARGVQGLVTTARYLAISVRARCRAAAPSLSTTVTAPSTTLTWPGGRRAARQPTATRSRISGTTARFALPPTLTSLAISPTSAAPRGPQVPSSSGASRPGRDTAAGSRGQPVRRALVQPRSSPDNSARTIAAVSRQVVCRRRC